LVQETRSSSATPHPAGRRCTAKRPGESRGHSPAGAAFTELVLETFRLNGRLLAAGDRLTKDIGLTSARWQVLGTLKNAADPIPVPQIARRMGLQRQSVQRIVDLLFDQGLVAFADNPNHRRAKLVLLTPKGRKVVDSARRLQVDWANRIAGGMSAGEIEAAIAVVRELRRRLGDRSAT
jgi:DNA-binding MarR family transcriptional regulator